MRTGGTEAIVNQVERTADLPRSTGSDTTDAGATVAAVSGAKEA
jgi:hypothetical protein